MYNSKLIVISVDAASVLYVLTRSLLVCTIFSLDYCMFQILFVRCYRLYLTNSNNQLNLINVSWFNFIQFWLQIAWIEAGDCYVCVMVFIDDYSSTVMNSNFGQNPLSNYSKVQNIGKGAYGVVFKAIDKKNNQFVAMKKIILEMENEGFPSTSIREISLLREIEHKNVVALKDVVIDQKQLYLVFEYLEKDLKFYLDSLGNKTLDSNKVKRFLWQILSGIADCHMKRVIHRDIKPANILLDKNENIKIADFGLARTFSIPVRPYSQEVVTLWYRAPEILLGSNQYSTPIDIWSIGCVFVEMITKRPLFAGDSELDQLMRIFRILGTPNEQTWPGVTKLRDYKATFPNWPPNQIQNVVSNLNLDSYGLDLLTKMLKYDPNNRITAKAALRHPYFKDLN